MTMKELVEEVKRLAIRIEELRIEDLTIDLALEQAGLQCDLDALRKELRDRLDMGEEAVI